MRPGIIARSAKGTEAERTGENVSAAKFRFAEGEADCSPADPRWDRKAQHCQDESRHGEQTADPAGSRPDPAGSRRIPAADDEALGRWIRRIRLTAAEESA